MSEDGIQRLQWIDRSLQPRCALQGQATQSGLVDSCWRIVEDEFKMQQSQDDVDLVGEETGEHRAAPKACDADTEDEFHGTFLVIWFSLRQAHLELVS